jgi:hypothetical protein
LVLQIDDLDTQIQMAKNSIVEGNSLTELEVNLLFSKIGQRALLNHELQKLRDGESLMICALIMILCIFLTFRTQPTS